MGMKSQKKSLMQRLTNWLDQLPLGRRHSRRDGRGERRGKTSHSAAPTCRAPPPQLPPPRGARDRRMPLEVKGPFAPLMFQSMTCSTHSGYASDRERIPPQMVSSVNIPRLEGLPQGGSLSQSFSGSRQRIRTNPWISREQNERASMRAHTIRDINLPARDLSYSSLGSSQNSSNETLRVKSFDESVCSSGYGSNDSSPESSVHSPNWQTSREDKAIECRSIDVDEALGFLEETSSFGPYDNLDDDEHIYHELEFLTRRSPSVMSECLPSCSSRVPSPIYARPYEGPLARPYVEERYPYLEAASRRQLPQLPCAMPRAELTRAVPRRPAPQFRAPPPPSDADDAMLEAELEFLAELDAQIAELQMKSNAVRSFVDEARERRAVSEWQKARWQQHNFELCL